MYTQNTEIIGNSRLKRGESGIYKETLGQKITSRNDEKGKHYKKNELADCFAANLVQRKIV